MSGCNCKCYCKCGRECKCEKCACEKGYCKCGKDCKCNPCKCVCQPGEQCCAVKNGEKCYCLEGNAPAQVEAPKCCGGCCCGNK